MKKMIHAPTIVGRRMGNVIRRSVVKKPAPATCAASSRSGFIARNAGHSHRNASGSSCSVPTQTMPQNE